MNVVTLKRPVTLGGSTAAAAAGIDPHLSRVMLWAELTGRVERMPSEAMRWGTLLQPVIMDELTARGYIVTSAWDTEGLSERRDAERPWLIGHPDGVVTLDSDTALLEVKTAGPFTGKWGDDPPVAYVAQCQVYMYLTGLRRALLACLVGGQRLELRTVDYEPDATAELLARMELFMGYVERDEPPPPDGSESSRDALAAMFPGSVPERVYRLTAAEWKILAELRALKDQGKALAEQIRERENVLKLAMGDAEIAISPHDAKAITWKYYDTTETRRFTIA